MAVSDVFLVKSIFTGIAKLGVEAAVDASVEATTETGAHLSTNGVNLAKQLASEEQMSQVGNLIYDGTELSPATTSRLAGEYGGNPLDWSKMTSTSYTSMDGIQFETHWYENITTGARVEYKTKFWFVP